MNTIEPAYECYEHHWCEVEGQVWQNIDMPLEVAYLTSLTSATAPSIAYSLVLDSSLRSLVTSLVQPHKHPTSKCTHVV